MKKIILLILVFSLIGLVSAQTVVTGTYSENFYIDASSYPLSPCNVQSNYESGSCQYLYACYVVVPRGSTDLDQAVQRECIDITDSRAETLHVSLVPPKGIRWAVTTFVGVLEYEYNYNTLVWEKELVIPIDYRRAEELISLCPEGQMLKYNICYHAQSVCLDTFSTNLCDNPYPLYVLDMGYGFEYNNPSTYCADRDEDLMCDEVVSVTCPDVNDNGICDGDDLAIQDTACIDANHNFVCDNVESEGAFCRTYFDPVHCGTDLGCITYPNPCFAEAVGCSGEPGVCESVYGDYCFVDADCPSMCDGVIGQCKNPDGNGNRCFYAGECNPQQIQCSVDEDCPAPYCMGVDRICTEQNTCTYLGRCITQPVAPQTFWNMLRDLWNSFIQWLNSIFS